MKKFLAFIFLLWLCGGANAQWAWPNKVNVIVTANVTYDNNTGLFTYTYALTSASQSVQEVGGFHVPLRGGTVVNMQSPLGWEFAVNRDGSIAGWCACAEEGFVIPPGYVQDGRGLPSIYQIKPGQTLAGFSFQSPDPPSTGTFYAQGWVPIPIEDVDFPAGQEPYEPDFPDNLFKGETQTPLRSESFYPGGRRPAVDGFLSFLTLKDGDAKQAPVLVDIVFGANGEAVAQATFRALLNDVDVTGQFVVMDANRRRAYFQLGTASALKVGRNVLVTTVDGTVPGATRSATDTDRVVFLVQ